MSCILLPLSNVFGKPILNDSGLTLEKIAGGLAFPTNMAFLGKDDILVLEKDKGTVNRIIDGQLLPHPLLQFNVSNGGLMLGITIAKEASRTLVFVSLAEAGEEKSYLPIKGGVTLLNRLYRYEFINNELIKPKLISKASQSSGAQILYSIPVA